MGRITFTPSGEGYAFEASTRFDKLFSGMVAPRPTFIPRGVPEHLMEPENTFNGDYGRILATAQTQHAESATGKGWRARQDSNLRPPA